MTRSNYSRRDFLTQAVAAPAIVAGLSVLTDAATREIIVASPNGRIRFHLANDGSQLTFRATLNNREAIQSSRLSISLDTVGLTTEARIIRIERYRIRENYPTRGGHSTATNH